MRKMIWLVVVAGLAGAGGVVVAGLGCGGCYEGTCCCSDGTRIPARSVPCDCDQVCTAHGAFGGACLLPEDAGTDTGADAAVDAPVGDTPAGG